MTEGCIYVLKDPRTDTPKYVGATKNPDSRLYNHKCSEANQDVAEWLQELESEGAEPEMEIVAEGPADELQELEDEYIDSLSEDYELLNRTETSAYSPNRGGKTEWTSIRVSKEAKKAAEESKGEGETWNEYLKRCTDNPPEVREFVERETETPDIEDIKEHLETDAPTFDDVKQACQAAIRDELPEVR